MSRARYFEVAADTVGRPLASVTVNVYQSGTTTPITETIYAAATGGATLANPLSANAQGEIEFFLAVPKRVDLAWSKTGFTAESHAVDVVAADAWILGTEKAAANGVATLGADGFVPIGQLPDGAALDAEVATVVAAHAVTEAAARTAAIAASEALSNGTLLAAPADVIAETQTAIPGGQLKVPSDLNMALVSRQRMIPDASPTEFVVYDEDFHATAVDPASILKMATAAGSGTVTMTGGKWLATAGGSGWTFTAGLRTRLRAPHLDVSILTNGPLNQPAVGFQLSATNKFFVTYNSTTEQILLGVVLGGAASTYATVNRKLVGPVRLRLRLAWPVLVAMVDVGEGWEAVASARISGYARDLTSLAEWNTWSAYYGDTLAANTISSISHAEVCYAPAWGVRDPGLMVYNDGAPFVRDSKYYLSVTLATAGADTYGSNHWGLISFDPRSYRAELVAHYFFTVDAGSVDSLYAGHWLYDDTTDTFRFLVCQWGKDGATGPGAEGTPFQLWTGTTRADITSGVHVLDATAVPLPPVLTGQFWDPSLRIDAGVYKLVIGQNLGGAHVGTSPSLFTGASLNAMTLLAQDTTRDAEGTRWAKIGGQWWIIAAGVTSPQNFQCWDDDLTYVGALTTWNGFDGLPGYGGGITDTPPSPHPCLIPVADESKTRYVLVSFDRTAVLGGKATGGALCVMEAAEIVDGHEFPRRHLVRGW